MQIHGVEVTQGIQYFRAGEHLAGVVAPDNSIALVAGRPAWVRVYLRSDGGSPVTGVTGDLVVERLIAGVYEPHSTLLPRPPGSVTIDVDPGYDEERRDLALTLNFVIPHSTLCGALRLTVEAHAPDGEEVTTTVHIIATTTRTLRVRGIMVSYDGLADDGTPLAIPAPGLSDLVQAGAWATKVYPISVVTSFSVAGTFQHGQTVASGAGGCGAPLNWGGLVANYLQVKLADGDKQGHVYYGLVAAGTPGADSAGCGGPAWVFSGAGEGPGLVGLDGSHELTAETTFAHELGHHLERQHAPGLTPDPDPGYPPYSSALPGVSLPPGSIGEYGIDIDTGTVYPPSAFADFMSYQPRRWISPYGWQHLANQPALNPRSVCGEGLPGASKPPVDVQVPIFDLKDIPTPYRATVLAKPVISVIAVVGPGPNVDVRVVARPTSSGRSSVSRHRTLLPCSTPPGRA